MKIASLLLILLAGSTISPSTAEIRFSDHRSDGSPIIPIDEFGFTSTGFLELNVSRIEVSSPRTAHNFSRLGFLLTTREAWFSAAQQNEDLCALQIPAFDVVFTFDGLPQNPNNSYSFNVVHRVKKPGQYTLLFADCMGFQVSMHVASAMYNVDSDTGARDYLSAGADSLPLVFFLFFLAYLSSSVVWAVVLYKKRLTAFRIHYCMLALVLLKAVNLLCEAEDRSYVKRTGSPHGWDVPFYVFSFLKGITLFVVIVLIGTGWSFLKPHLQDKEKKVLMVVIPLQVIANIARVVLDEGPYATGDSVAWSQILMLVDIVCCCAVLFPIVWSMKRLRDAARTDGKAAANLMKLTLFRHYYIVVICYVYFTRIGVFALSVIVSYRYLWTTEVAQELGTLALFVFTGYKFRPEAHNPYFAIEDAEEDDDGEAFKLDDEFEL